MAQPNRLKSTVPRNNNFRTPFYGQIWNNSQKTKDFKKKVNFQTKNNNNSNHHQAKSFPKNAQRKKLSSSLLNLESYCKQLENIEDRPTSIYLHNDRDFLNSLRNFNEQKQYSETRRTNFRFRTTSLARYMRMSKEIVDDFVRLKTDEFENINDHHSYSVQNPVVEKIDQMSPLLGKTYKKNVNSNSKKRILRPKSAITSIRRRSASSSPSSMTNGIVKTIKHNNDNDGDDDNKAKSFSDEEIVDNYHNNDIDEKLKPLFHRSMDKISSIANWERQIRYEFEIEKELQKRELERQKEKLQNDQRKLEDWDKQLRIELDARERKLRLGEDELKSRLEEYQQKTQELMRREQMINEIVAERIKTEMKFEIEKLRKKFNELEVDKSNLIKKEERVKEVEARLHEQVKIVKEKIDSKRISDIELAKYRKELEITKKENEVLKEKVDSMEDYQITKFENRAIKNELQILKESLDNKNQELDRDRERWEREQRSTDQKIMSLKRDLRKSEQELFLLKQKSQADQEEIASKYEAANGQVKRLQAFIKDHLAKLNNEFSTTTQTMNRLRHSTSQTLLATNNKSNQHQINHLRGHSLYHMPGSHNHQRSFHHQRSVSMDGFHKPQRARGCRLCNDDEFESYRNGGFEINRMADCIQSDEEEELQEEDRFSCSSIGADDGNDIPKESNHNKSTEMIEKIVSSDNNETKEPENFTANSSSDDFVKKIVDRIYEKMSTNKVPESLPEDGQDIDELFVQNNSVENQTMNDQKNKYKNGPALNFSINGHEKSLEDHFNQSLNVSNQSHNNTTTHLHPSLYEELLLASELETSTSPPPANRLNITNNLDLINQDKLSPINSKNIIASEHKSPLSNHHHNQSNNDTNNNRINNHLDNNQQRKNQSSMITSIINDDNNQMTNNNTNNNLNRPNSNDSHSTKTSESFEIDW